MASYYSTKHHLVGAAVLLIAFPINALAIAHYIWCWTRSKRSGTPHPRPPRLHQHHQATLHHHHQQRDCVGFVSLFHLSSSWSQTSSKSSHIVRIPHAVTCVSMVSSGRPGSHRNYGFLATALPNNSLDHTHHPVMRTTRLMFYTLRGMRLSPSGRIRWSRTCCIDEAFISSSSLACKCHSSFHFRFLLRCGSQLYE
jgi:hypothetical protein